MKLFRSVATKTIEQPSRQYVHNHTPNYPGIIITVSGITLLLLVGLYHWILDGLATLGASNPKAMFFTLLFGSIVSLLFLLAGSWFVNWHLEQRHKRRLEWEDIRYRRLLTEHKMQQSVVNDTREIDPHLKRRNALIVALMVDAFHGTQNFSYRKAGQYVLTNESKPVGKDSKVVRDALTWLRENEAIEGNNLTDKFGSIGDVQRALHRSVMLKK